MSAVYDQVEAMAKEEPNLLKCKCPRLDGDNIEDDEDDSSYALCDWEGHTALECMCMAFSNGCDAWEILLQLVQLGAVATNTCYNISAFPWGITNVDVIGPLLLAGFMPLDGSLPFFLDEMVDRHDGDPTLELCGDHGIAGIMEILNRRVAVGSNLCNVRVTERVMENFQKLPELRPGVTHEEGGDFDKLNKMWLKQ